MKSNLRWLAVGMLAVSLAAPAVDLAPRPQHRYAGNLIVNGTFEGPDEGAVLTPGSTTIAYWMVMGGQVRPLGKDLTRRVGLGAKGIISQRIRTRVGQVYLLSFDMTANLASQALKKNVQVKAGPTTQMATFDVMKQSVSRPWMMVNNLRFTADSTDTTISFTSTDGDEDGPQISDVGVVKPLDKVDVLRPFELN